MKQMQSAGRQTSNELQRLDHMIQKIPQVLTGCNRSYFRDTWMVPPAMQDVPLKCSASIYIAVDRGFYIQQTPWFSLSKHISSFVRGFSSPKTKTNMKSHFCQSILIEMCSFAGGDSPIVCIYGPGTHFTNDFSITIQIRWKFHLALIQLLVIISRQNLTHATTA